MGYCDRILFQTKDHKGQHVCIVIVHWEVGLHGENGIDPETSISLLRTYVPPILYYGLEILLPTGKILNQLNIHYKKVLKQIISLYTNVADPAIYILSGLLPIEAEIHIKALKLKKNWKHNKIWTHLNWMETCREAATSYVIW
jgi:hypothetical protein